LVCWWQFILCVPCAITHEIGSHNHWGDISFKPHIRDIQLYSACLSSGSSPSGASHRRRDIENPLFVARGWRIIIVGHQNRSTDILMRAAGVATIRELHSLARRIRGRPSQDRVGDVAQRNVGGCQASDKDLDCGSRISRSHSR